MCAAAKFEPNQCIRTIIVVAFKAGQHASAPTGDLTSPALRAGPLPANQNIAGESKVPAVVKPMQSLGLPNVSVFLFPVGTAEHCQTFSLGTIRHEAMVF
jgi:hypothetical protein